MKTLLFNIFFLFLVVFLSGCNEDILYQENPNQQTADQFWKSEDDALLGINATYSALQDIGAFSRWHTYAYDCRSDEVYNLSPWTELQNFTKFTISRYDFDPNRDLWMHMYVIVYRSNQVIDHVPGISMNGDLKRRIVAEAKFLRALAFYNLGTLFGNIPLVLKESAPEDRPDQKTQTEIYNQIIADLNSSIPDLPDSYGASELGRVTKGAGRALLGKVYMQQHEWVKAAEQFGLVINSPANYKLINTFKDNFTDVNENNQESIFEVQFKAGESNCRDCPGGAEGNERAIFFAPSGVGWNEGNFRSWVLDEFLKEKTADGKIDPRLTVTMFYNKSLSDPTDPDTLVYGIGFIKKFGKNKDKTWFRKYQNDYKQNFEGWQSGINCRLIRLADIYLLYAEASNEIDNISTAVEYIDKVRARSNISSLLNVKPSWNKDEIRTQLQTHERVLELAGEGTRWFDLARWGWLEDPNKILDLKAKDEDFDFFVPGTSIFLPIPTHEINNNPKLIQNNGY